ncbi:hypothetical protein PCE1_002440 [Barthelona sp. PCE]
MELNRVLSPLDGHVDMGNTKLDVDLETVSPSIETPAYLPPFFDILLANLRSTFIIQRSKNSLFNIQNFIKIFGGSGLSDDTTLTLEDLNERIDLLLVRDTGVQRLLTKVNNTFCSRLGDSAPYSYYRRMALALAHCVNFRPSVTEFNVACELDFQLIATSSMVSKHIPTTLLLSEFTLFVLIWLNETPFYETLTELVNVIFKTTNEGAFLVHTPRSLPVFSFFKILRVFKNGTMPYYEYILSDTISFCIQALGHVPIMKGSPQLNMKPIKIDPSLILFFEGDIGKKYLLDAENRLLSATVQYNHCQEVVDALFACTSALKQYAIAYFIGCCLHAPLQLLKNWFRALLRVVHDVKGMPTNKKKRRGRYQKSRFKVSKTEVSYERKPITKKPTNVFLNSFERQKPNFLRSKIPVPPESILIRTKKKKKKRKEKQEVNIQVLEPSFSSCDLHHTNATFFAPSRVILTVEPSKTEKVKRNHKNFQNQYVPRSQLAIQDM